MPSFTFPSTVLLIAVAGAALRRTRPLWRWTAASALFAVITAWWMSGTHPPQSVWLNVPVIGAATSCSVLVGSLGRFQERPTLAFVASAAATLAGLLLGMIVAIELGLLIP